MVVACGYGVLTLFARIFAKWGLLGVEDIIIAVGYVSFASASEVIMRTDFIGICGRQLGTLRPGYEARSRLRGIEEPAIYI